MRTRLNQWWVLLIIGWLVAIGCSDDKPIGISPEQVDGSDGGYTGDVSDVESRPRDSENVQEEEFEKPEEAHPMVIDREFRDPADYEDEDPDDWGTTVGYWGREHMKPTLNFEESWLYPGEYFVRDGFYIYRGRSWLPGKIRVSAIANGELLPIRFVRVYEADEYPSLEEIEAWDEDEFSYAETVDVEAWVPVNYTLVIPPWAFPEEGAYNVHTLSQVRWQPQEDRELFGEGLPVHQGHTIYYGSERFLLDETEFDDRQDATAEWNHHTEAGKLISRMVLGLTPSPDVHDWPGEDFPEGAGLGDVIESSEPELQLELYTAGNYGGFHYQMDGPALYYVMKDGEIADVFFYDAPKIEGYLGDNRGKAIPVDVNLPLDGSLTTVRVVQTPTPFETYGDTGNYAQESNVLFLRYNPEKN